MKTFYLFIIVLIFSCLHAQAQTWQWTHPEATHDINSLNHAHDVEIDSSGNVYVLGSYWDSLFLSGNFIAKGYGSYLAKYNPSGSLLWYKLITSPDVTGLTISATDMVINANGIFITGTYIPTNPYYYDCNTGIYSGTYLHYQIGNLNFTSSYNELGFFLTKLNSNGSVVWNKLGTYNACVGSAGAGSFNTSPNITSDKNGNIITSFLLGSDNLSTISIAGDNIPIQSGYTMSQLMVVKYTSNGVFKMSAHTSFSYTSQVGGTSYQQVTDCNSIVADNNGNIFLYGTANDSTYFGSKLFRTSTPPSEDKYYYPATFIAKLSSGGVWQFAKELCNGSANTIGYNDHYGKANPDLLAIDDNNNVYALVNASSNSIAQIILGDTTGHNKYGSNFLVKMTNDGNLVWDKFFAAEVFSYSHSICYYNNNLYLNGATRPSPDLLFSKLFIPYNSNSGIGQESFVGKTDLDGNFQWVAMVGTDYYDIQGFGIKVFRDNIYTCGDYYSAITTLGNLNGPFPTDATSIFFGKLKDQYISVGTVSPTTLIPGCTVSVPFTSYNLNFSAQNKFIAELSNENGDFSSPKIIGSVKSKNSGTITATIPATLAYGSGYRIRIRSSDTLPTGYNYYAYADTGYALTLTCSAPSSGFTVTNITGTSATVNWNKINCASGYRIQYRVKGTTNWNIAGTITNNNVSSFNLTGLNANTTYQWRVATRCKSTGTFVFSAYTAAKQFTTLTAFADVNSDNISLTTLSINASVYPNPASNNATVIFNSPATENYSIQLTDETGKVFQSKTGISTHGENKVLLNLNNYTPGLYFIYLIDGNQNKITLKLNKQ